MMNKDIENRTIFKATIFKKTIRLDVNLLKKGVSTITRFIKIRAKVP
jgi:hypothetical protein